MISVAYCGTAFGGGEGMTYGCAGVFSTVGAAVEAAIRHRGKWLESHIGMGLRPIVYHTDIPAGDADLSRIDISACGGWGDSLYINYKFERVNLEGELSFVPSV